MGQGVAGSVEFNSHGTQGVLNLLLMLPLRPQLTLDAVGQGGVLQRLQLLKQELTAG